MDVLRWHAAPDRRLASHIDRYWGWEGIARLPRNLLPGTGAECLFHYAQPFLLNRQEAPRATLLCPRSHPIAIASTGPVGFVAVRFRSGRLRHFCNRPLAELHDREWAAEQVWGGAAAHLSERLSSAGSHAARVKVLDAFFLARLGQHEDRTSAALDALLDRLYYAPATPIDALTAQSGWTRRHFLRKFTDAYGIGPKHFARIARLNHTMRILTLTPATPPLDAALRMGYFDQAHFIHETRALAGATPQTVLGWLPGMSHFYNPPSRPVAYADASL